MKVIKASEVSTYLFCHRAWWYAQQEIAPLNLETLADGKDFHESHARQVRFITSLRLASLSFVVLSIILVVFYILLQ